MACRLATWPTRRWPSSVNATTDGVVRAPSAFGITSALPPSIVAATTELVVPRSIPTALGISVLLSRSSMVVRPRPELSRADWLPSQDLVDHVIPARGDRPRHRLFLGAALPGD